jgi:hypothetical protein
MPHLLEPVGPGIIQCSEDCPFCSNDELLGYKTKNGDLKDEKVLGSNLASTADITSDKAVGNVFPLSGGGDSTTGWEAEPGVLEDFAVKLAAAPHHIIPGKAAMAPSRLEKWTMAGDKIKEDIGYSIDCAQNGIFLPHLPEIYWTRHVKKTKTPMAQFYGQTWAGLSDSAKSTIGDVVMGETSLQMHYTDHDDPYVHVDNDTNYDDECKRECNELADLMQLFEINAKCKDSDGKLNPPYGLVHMINARSTAVRLRITGFPSRWTSWVSPLAQGFTHRLRTTEGAPLARFSGKIRTLTA